MKLDISKIIASINPIKSKDPVIAGFEAWKKKEEAKAAIRSQLIDQEAKLFQANMDWYDLHAGLEAAQLAKANPTTIRALDDACWASLKRKWRAEETIEELKKKLANL